MEAALEKNSVLMEKYLAYKDAEWHGHIPEEWMVVRFRNFFSFSKGLIITKENLKDRGIPCVNYGEIHSKYGFELDLSKHPLKCVDKELVDHFPDALLTKGDIVFADTSEDIEGSGNFTQLVSEGVVVAGYHTIIARPKPYVNSRFMAYVLDSVAYRDQLRRAVKGVKVYSITKTILKNALVWFPTLHEQTAIASFLDRKTEQIDKAIAIKEKQIELLQERRQILIQNIVTGKKVWNQDKNAWTEPAEVKDSGVEWIGEVPEHWEVKALKFIAYLQSGETISSDDFTEGGYPVYGGNGFRGYTDRYTNEGMHALIGRQGALCGNVNYADGKFFASEHAIVAYPLKNENVLWLGEVMKVANFNRLSQSAAQPGIAVGIIKNVMFPYPPIQEQNSIAQFVQSLNSKVTEAIALQQKQIEKLKEYKTSLINAAVTGKVKVV